MNTGKITRRQMLATAAAGTIGTLAGPKRTKVIE